MSDEINLLSIAERKINAAQQIGVLGYGGAIGNEEMEQLSLYKAGSQEFSFFVSDVRKLLAEKGYWLSGEGQDGQGFFIVRPNENAIVSARNRNKAQRSLETMRVLMENTDLSALNEAEKRRHERELREIRYTERLLARRKDVVEVIKKHSPGILQDDIEL